MLDVASILRRSGNGRFDTVFFFDRSNDKVVETQRRIPGAIGFPGDFVDLVLLPDPIGDAVLDSSALLNPPDEEANLHEVRAATVQSSQRLDFISSFPFDVINLDLEQFFLRPNDPFPGKMIRALRKVFEWQRRPLMLKRGRSEWLKGFSLMFTTQIGPPNLTPQYLEMLRNTLTANFDRDGQLAQSLRGRAGTDDIAILQEMQFELFFKLGVPKVLASILKDEDWYVDSEQGIKTYEFERPWKDGSYRMLHFVMDVVRQQPPYDQRAQRTPTDGAETAYQEVVRGLVSTPEVFVTLETIDQVALQRSLDRIKARRRLDCPECPEQ